jgi:hypothetical protein
MKNRRFLPVLLVGGTIALGIAIIIVSLSANRHRWDRETALAAAKYDGAAILALLDGEPAPALGVPEMESGPLAPDLSNAEEAWVAWRQTFSAANGLAAAVAWHRERLPAADWTLSEENPDKATFRKGEWAITLETVPRSEPPGFRREVKWTRDPAVL